MSSSKKKRTEISVNPKQKRKERRKGRRENARERNGGGREALGPWGRWRSLVVADEKTRREARLRHED